jgi:excisionase family DNA binding protein
MDETAIRSTTEPDAYGGSRTGLGAQRDRRVWSVDETAQLLGISRAHAYELIGRNVLPHIRLGRRIVVPKRAVEELLNPPEQVFEA